MPVNTVYDVWSTVGFLMDHGYLYQRPLVTSEWFPLIPQDAWKVIRGVNSIVAAFMF